MTISEARVVVADFEQELQSILAHFFAGGSGRLISCAVMHYHPLTDGCVVSAWDAWARFVRRLMLLSAAGPVKGTTGAIYVPAKSRSEVDALRRLIDQRNNAHAAYGLAFGRTGEPKWYQVRDAYDLASALDLQNGQIIGDALTLSRIPVGGGLSVGNPVGEMQRVRNYIAHKSDTNLRKAVRGIPLPSGASQLEGYLGSRSTGGSVIFADWIDGLVGIAHQAAR